jgi:hypothetical protein
MEKNMTKSIILFSAALIMVLLANPAQARKVALIVANSEYEATSTLANPASDAALVAAAAETADFDEVIRVNDATMDEFVDALRAFSALADGADVAMVYYAGHGMEGKGKNWLLPVDAKLEMERDLPFEAIELGVVVDAMEGAQVKMVVLDACRNNPYARKWKSKTRAVNRGLAPIEADDVIVIYAAAPGMVAFDGGEANSPFAASLAKRLPQPDLPLQLLGGAVRDDVLAATDSEQRPFVSASVTGTPIYLVPRSQRSDLPFAPGEIKFVVENIVVRCIKTTETFGEDEVYLLVNNGERMPELDGSKFDIDTGETWTVSKAFSSIAPISLTLMEDDPIGDHDRIGTIETGTQVGSFTKTFEYDRGKYEISYDLRLGG